MGTTIWSLHFIAMMAVEFPVLINHNIVETILSICFAIAATAVVGVTPSCAHLRRRFR